MWLERVNSTVHGTTHEIPFERLNHEKLLPVNDHPFKIVKKESRKIARECYVSYLGNKYSVPYQYAGRISEIQISDGKFKVFVDGDQLCEHEIVPGNSRVIKKKEHFKGLYAEILKQNSASRKAIQIPFKFTDVEVESRPLAVYDSLCEGDLR